ETIAGKIGFTEASFQQLKDLVVTKWMLGNQDQMRLPGNTGPEREMARVPAHNFDHLDPAMRTRGCARTFDDLSHISQCSIEAERVISAGEIFVDRLWNTNHRHTFLCQTRGH